MASTLFVAASSASSWGNGARRSQTACRMLSAELPFSHSGVRHASVSVLGATRREHEPLLGVRRVGAREADSTSGQRRLEQLLDEFDDMQLLATQLGVERMEIAPLMVRAACGQLVSLREQSIPAPNDDTLFKALVELKQRDADRAPMMHELRNAHTFPVDLNELTTKEWEVVFAAEHKSGKLSYAGAPGAMPRARVDFQLRADHRSNGAQVIRGTMREVSEIMPGVSAFGGPQSRVSSLRKTAAPSISTLRITPAFRSRSYEIALAPTHPRGALIPRAQHPDRTVTVAGCIAPPALLCIGMLAGPK
eukprot:CAMPEP_0185838960 /NCGR_PEP_ID=MMETSP1353-20130828/13834_1 /TAXON_ID=1077150 /ORGANISM="Erythrolobus australicus, Strain CCMP3124" /LENGTH=306 /DNA_ID=CAMNT_0028538065 /DNA_START=102 /DNA_END=1023 /DNA_ORIENTATION=+